MLYNEVHPVSPQDPGQGEGGDGTQRGQPGTSDTSTDPVPRVSLASGTEAGTNKAVSSGSVFGWWQQGQRGQGDLGGVWESVGLRKWAGKGEGVGL